MSITGLENVGSTSDAFNANLRNKKHLQELEFEWTSHESATSNVASLSTQHVQLLHALQPHPKIGALTIKGFRGERFPNWLLCQNSLKYVKSLTLMNYDKVEEISSIDESLPNCKSLTLQRLKNLKKMPPIPRNLTYLEIDHIPQLSYFSEEDLLIKEECKQSKLEVVEQIAACFLKSTLEVELIVRPFLLFVKEKLEAVPEICITSSQCRIISEIMKCDPLSDGYSEIDLLFMWVMFIHYHTETMFDKNEEPKLILPSSLTHLKISSCSITSDALSTCIQSLVSLSKLELYDIQTITSLPPREVLCSLKNIQSLAIKRCYLLNSLGGIGALTSLIELELDGCFNLNTSNEPFPSSLERLEFVHCSNVDAILDESNLPKLCVLKVGNCKSRRGVLHIGHMSCLKELSILRWDGRLEGLNSVTELCTLMVLSYPEINPSSPVEKYASALGLICVDNLLLLKLVLSNETISSLVDLVICNLEGDIFDDEVFLSLTSLKYLFGFDCNIIHMPKNLKNLTSLQYMYICNCPKLCELEELPGNLHVLELKDCPNLTVKFNKGGPYRVQFHEGNTIVTFPTEGV